jgi:hypothetical protein
MSSRSRRFDVLICALARHAHARAAVVGAVVDTAAPIGAAVVSFPPPQRHQQQQRQQEGKCDVVEEQQGAAALLGGCN